MTPLSATRTVAKLADPAAVDALLAPLPSPLLIRASLINASGQRHLVQYDAGAGVMHYVAANGVNAVRLSVKGLSEQQAPLAVLTAHEVLTLSAQDVANAFGRLFRHPAVFIDLDIPLTRIRHAQSKVYFLDAVKPTAEKAGASFTDARRGSL